MIKLILSFTLGALFITMYSVEYNYMYSNKVITGWNAILGGYTAANTYKVSVLNNDYYCIYLRDDLFPKECYKRIEELPFKEGN